MTDRTVAERMGGDPPRGAPRVERTGDPRGHDVLAVHPQSEAREGDAELGGGDEAVLFSRLLENPLHDSGDPMTGARPALDRQPWRADDGEFGGHEEPVEGDQHGDHHDGQDAIHGAPPSIPARGVTSRVPGTRPCSRSTSIRMPSMVRCSPSAGRRPRTCIR